jgi:hypothetical protein
MSFSGKRSRKAILDASFRFTRIWGIVNRASKLGKIRKEKRGLYVAV